MVTVDKNEKYSIIIQVKQSFEYLFEQLVIVFAWKGTKDGKTKRRTRNRLVGTIL
jgi:hypothetical protein